MLGRVTGVCVGVGCLSVEIESIERYFGRVKWIRVAGHRNFFFLEQF